MVRAAIRSRILKKKSGIMKGSIRHQRVTSLLVRIRHGNTFLSRLDFRRLLQNRKQQKHPFHHSRASCCVKVSTQTNVLGPQTIWVICLAITWAGLVLPMKIHAIEVESIPDIHAKGSLPHEPLGLFQSSDFELTTGNCTACNIPQQALWYFQDEVIAIPKITHSHRDPKPLPFLVWLGSSEILHHSQLDKSGSEVTLPKNIRLPLKLTQKISSNRSYYDNSTSRFFQNRQLRLRGHVETIEGTPTFVTRMIWPENFRLNIHENSNEQSAQLPTLSHLIEMENGGASAPFLTKTLWKRNPGTSGDWSNHAVLGFMLNGAQGDDDEAHGGHFGIVTGRVGPEGEMAHWMMNNFYDLDIESEKGIIPGMLPMDQYLMDLNSGQSYYRPSYLLVAILRQDRIAHDVQGSAQRIFESFYRHDFLYHHAKSNCTGLSIDILRRLGWDIPMKGPTSYLKAIGAFYYVATKEQSLNAGEKIYDYLTQEQTRLFPRMAFETAGQDLLQIVEGTVESPGRILTQYERLLQDNVEAIVFIRIPQIPSSRAFGTYPVLTFNDYQNRVPENRDDWEVVPVPSRPFPDQFPRNLRTKSILSFLTPTKILVALPIALVSMFLVVAYIRIKNEKIRLH